MSSEEEQEFERLLIELRVLEGSVGSLQTRIGLVEAALRELSVTSSTLEGLGEEERGSHILVPIGGDSYVRASVEDSERIVFGIGAGVAIEKAVDEAKSEIEGHMAEYEKVRMSLRQQLDQLIEDMNKVRSRIEAITRSVREGKSGV